LWSVKDVTPRRRRNHAGVAGEARDHRRRTLASLEVPEAFNRIVREFVLGL
jgi:hypothetical protein